MTVWVKNTNYISECYLTILPKVTPFVSVCCLVFKPQDYVGWPASCSFCRVCRFSPAATCVLYNGQMCIQPNMAEPTSVIFSPWKIKNCPWKVPRKPGWIFETNLGTLKEFMDLLEQHSCTCATVQNTFPQFDSMKLMQLSITNSEKCTGNHPVNL